MTNGAPTPAEKLAKAVSESTITPEPPRWVQGWQIFLALLCICGGIAVAVFLIWHGPPAPVESKGAEASAGVAISKPGGPSDVSLPASDPITTYVANDTADPAGGEASGEATTGDSESQPPSGDTEGSEEPEASSGSLANLNEQAPWAFAIVALVVGAFLATGKSLNVLGIKRDEVSSGNGVENQ